MSGDPSRPFKWVTVVCSVVTVGFLVAAAVRENVSADWRGHQAVCHQGQGAALNFEEAKAEDYFWDYPLLPAKFTEATDAFISQTIRAGRENTPMPAFGRAGVSESQIGDLLAYIRKWQPPTKQARSQHP